MIDPWGTPHPTTALSEICWPTCVVCVRYLRYEGNQSLIVPRFSVAKLIAQNINLQ